MSTSMGPARRPGWPTIVHALADAGANHGERTALICGDNSLTYAQYATGAAVIADRLNAVGMKRGDRIAVVAATSVTVPVAVLGTMAAGCQPAMMNPNYRAREMVPLFRIAKPKAAFCDPASCETVAALPEAKGVRILPLPEEEDLASSQPVALDPACGPDDAAILLFTGGTTGISKGVSHTHAGMMAAQDAVERRWETDLDGEVYLNIPPLFHIIGAVHGILQPIYGRSTAVFLPRFHPDLVFDALAVHEVSIFSIGVPTAYTALMNHERFEDFDFSHLKFAAGGGAPLAEETLRAWEAATKVPALEGYGMTEGAPTCLNPRYGKRKPLSVGRPVDNVTLQIVDIETGTRELGPGEPGEIRVKGPHVAHEYVNDAEASRAAFRDGWLHTGDIAYKDADGYVFIVDRSKDMAIVSGFNVFPREIDEVLAGHPKVKEAAAVGVPDSYRGEVIRAYVVAKDGAALSEDELRTYCEENLVDYKVPKQFQFVAELPKTPVGKIDKKLLRV